MSNHTNTPEFHITPSTTISHRGITSAARAVPASLVHASRAEISETLADLPVGGQAQFEAKWGRAADLGGHTSVIVQRTA